MYRYPTFATAILDRIDRSIEEGERKSGDVNLYREKPKEMDKLGGFSSSGSDSMCPAPPRPKLVRTTVWEEKEREVHKTYDFHHHSTATQGKSKSCASKMYSNLKNLKHRGGRLMRFLNSLCTRGNTKKLKNKPSMGGFEDVKAVSKTYLYEQKMMSQSTVEEAVRKQYLRKQKLPMIEEEHDAANCSSSDLFELDLDHLMSVKTNPNEVEEEEIFELDLDHLVSIRTNPNEVEEEELFELDLDHLVSIRTNPNEVEEELFDLEVPTANGLIVM